MGRHVTRARDLAAAFDARADSYARSDWHVRYAGRLVELAAPAPGAHVLDVATGTGFAALAAAGAVGPTGRVVGVDVSAGMLDHARRAAVAAGIETLELVRADATDLAGFRADSFDLIVCAAGLLYMPVREALREWRRLVKVGGAVAFSSMRAGSPGSARMFRELAVHYGLMLNDPAAPLGEPDRCRRALLDAGFVPVDTIVETIRFSPDDVSDAWNAHVRGPHRQAIACLATDQLAAFRGAYTEAVHQALADDDSFLDAEVIYALGTADAGTPVSR